MAPRLDTLESFNRKPLGEVDMNNSVNIEEVKLLSPRKTGKQNGRPSTQKADLDIDSLLKTLQEQLAILMKAKPGREMKTSGMLMIFFSRYS